MSFNFRGTSKVRLTCHCRTLTTVIMEQMTKQRDQGTQVVLTKETMIAYSRSTKVLRIWTITLSSWIKSKSLPHKLVDLWLKVNQQNQLKKVNRRPNKSSKGLGHQRLTLTVQIPEWTRTHRLGAARLFSKSYRALDPSRNGKARALTL